MTEVSLKEQAIKGATVHFKCGGKAVISKVDGDWAFFEGYNSQYYLPNHKDECCISPFDIIRIDPPAFDWSTAKTGMGFRTPSNYRCWFMCKHFSNSSLAWFIDGFGDPVEHKKEGLTRAPEHDIEVKDD